MSVKKGLGRGLESLFAMYDEEVEESTPANKPARPLQKVALTWLTLRK